MSEKIVKTEAEWKAELTPAQYRIAREKGTEAPFSGEYWNNHDEGTYKCAACGATLFESDAKFDSSCGWPSFSAPADESKVEFHEDRAFGMKRTEVLCAKCDSHLGHVFDDGPRPTGQRFCINSAVIKLEKK